jgi:hypothetical protein
MKNKFSLFLLIAIMTGMVACETIQFEETAATGLWQQVSVSEDGTAITLTPEQQSLKLLIEPNGIIRYYHQTFRSYNGGNGPTTFYGTWSLLEGKWMNISTDKWQFNPTITTDSGKVVLTRKPNNSIDTIVSVQKQWAKFHIQSRFSIVKLGKEEMELQIKTFEGEKKYAMLFAPNPSDFIEIKNAGAGKDTYFPKLVTDDNYLTIRKEFQTLKTYVFKFRKVNY